MTKRAAIQTHVGAATGLLAVYANDVERHTGLCPGAFSSSWLLGGTCPLLGKAVLMDTL